MHAHTLTPKLTIVSRRIPMPLILHACPNSHTKTHKLELRANSRRAYFRRIPMPLIWHACPHSHTKTHKRELRANSRRAYFRRIPIQLI